MFLGKLKTWWYGPSIVRIVYFHGAVEIENPRNGDESKVNGQRLKPFLELKDKHTEDILLQDPIYIGMGSATYGMYLRLIVYIALAFPPLHFSFIASGTM